MLLSFLRPRRVYSHMVKSLSMLGYIIAYIDTILICTEIDETTL